jgi:hypothetical protein
MTTNRLAMKRTNAGGWFALLVVSGLFETAAFILAVIFAVSAWGQSDAAERSRLWASAGWWLLGSLAFTAVSAWSLVRLLRTIAQQVPGASSETSPS